MTITARAGPRGDFMTSDAIGAIVKARAKAAGIPDPSRITAHGLRPGPGPGEQPLHRRAPQDQRADRIMTDHHQVAKPSTCT